MNNKSGNLEELCTKLHVTYKELNFLKTAITHSSYANQNKSSLFNERLEFLGDAVLELCISDYLYTHFTNKTEGELTRIRAIIVCEESLHEIGRGFELGEYMLMGRGEELTGGRNRVSIIADCVEAIIASLYLDQGLAASRSFILEHFMETVNAAAKNRMVLDYKTKLQELLQKEGEVSIAYELTGSEGPDHHRRFFMQVLVNGMKSGAGEGFTKKEAEQNAAKQALSFLENTHE
jgi:ribonuclease III